MARLLPGLKQFGNETLGSKRVLVVGLVIAMTGGSLISCASHQGRATDSDSDAGFSLNLDPSSGEQRAPASVKIDSQLETIFQRMLSRGNLYDNLQLKIDQIEFAYWQGIAATADFDALLDAESKKANPTDDFQKLAFEKGLTPRLAALEVFRNNAQAQMSYYFLRLNEVYQEPSTNAETRAKIEEAFSDLDLYLRQVPFATRIALNGWAEEMYTLTPHSKVLQRAYKHLFVGQPEAMQAYLQTAPVIAHQNHMSQKYGHRRDDIWLEGLVETCREDQKAQFEEDTRSPQSISPANDQPADAVNARALTKGAVALAFEGSPHEIFTARIIDTLSAHHAKATFFIQGSRVGLKSAVVHKMIGAGYGIESYSYEPLELSKLFDEEITAQIIQSSNQIEAITAKTPRLLRPPFSEASARVRSIVFANGIRVVRANVFSYDWMDRDINHAARRVLMQTALAPSAIVALKMDLAGSSALTEQIVQGLQDTRSGKQLISLGEVLK